MKVRWEIEYDTESEAAIMGQYLNELTNEKFEFTNYNTWDGDIAVPVVILTGLKKEYKGQ